MKTGVRNGQGSHYLVFVTVALALAISGMGGTAVSVAFPVLTTEFQTNIIVAGWVLNIFQLVATVAMPLAGKISEIMGGRRTFIGCLIFWSVGSLGAALAPNIYFLIGARLLQSIGGGGFLPVASGIVAEEFPNSRQKVIGLFSSIFPIGQIIGPNLGGWMTEVYGWRSIFWLNVALGVIPLVLTLLYLKGRKKQDSAVDWLGSGLFAGAIASFLVGVTQAGNTQSAGNWGLAGGLIVASVIMMVLFVRHERRVANPIIDLALLRERPFLAANMFGIILGISYFSLSSFIPLFAVSVYGMSILQSGLVLTPMWFGLMVASAVTSVKLVKWGYRWPILAGTALTAVGALLMGMEFFGGGGESSPQAMVTLLLVIALTGAGMGLTYPAANNACIELMPDRVATIAGLRGTFRQTGGALGIAITTVVLHSLVDPALGFRAVFWGTAVVLLVGVPAVFFMPASCRTPSDGGGS